MLKYVTAGAVAGVLLLGSFQTALATNIVNFEVEINTKDDDKDKGEPINFQILKDNTIVVYDSGWFFGNWLLEENSYRYKKAPWFGHKMTVPMETDDCSKLKLRLEKMGEKSWKATFKLLANDRQLTLLSETPIVEFGKSHSILPEKPEGTGSAKTTHWNGGNIHIFQLNCPPAENK
ncbi:hypothetical protein MELA_00933 [Candidatus Methylomirabilis lanthanidiphila]|uniref:Uncharacterized protein n=1 Tax=Candidatus Methylomirabilis lanthanidiphila TaxID=2211376 RepID=A0A564ZGV2_9BACT|nr:hypothetical protein [Candidatus Methylomirabilis lanthanidiphila]VUZ84560.1 hypothetical protein MELA_00933 [Candidatus Methylomirabilis lanthanidiphila]